VSGDVVLGCRGLVMRFRGLTALDHLELDVRRGEILGLIGPNGSGKTTFFNVVTGLYRPGEGEIRFESRDITHASPQAIYRAGIARTFQRSRLCLPLTVFDNIMIGNHGRLNQGLWFNLFRRGKLRQQFDASWEEARELLMTFNKALGSKLAAAAGSVNMIDRRRIEVCRALVGRPKLLLLDEPSAGMTHEETHELMDDILAIRQRIPELTIVIIEHGMSVIERITDRCIVLNYGRKLCDGPYAEVARNPEVQQAYLGKS
jgi:ABC-type branched-subunit amino acid transport system ATPase component